jgi:transporter family protein
MKHIVLAIVTALCWSIGGFFEKKGLKLGNLTPGVGISIRTFVALVLLGLANFKQLHMVWNAGPKALAYMIIGGGVVAGTIGMLSFYAAISSGNLGEVLPIAFGLTPLVGFFMGVIFMNEPFSMLRSVGVFMVSIGVILITFR